MNFVRHITIKPLKIGDNGSPTSILYLTYSYVPMKVFATTGLTPKEVTLCNFIVLTRLYIKLYPSQLNNY